MLNLRIALCAVLSLYSVGCAALEKKTYLVCPYDTVWEVAMDTMKTFPVIVRNKEKGVIETAWTDMAATERPFGIFGRNAFDNKERARMTLTVDRVNDVTGVTLSEQRQRWHIRGGVTQQATKWTPIEPSEEAMAGVMSNLNAKLQDRGCSPS